MKRILLVVAILGVLAWAPWITEEYAINKVAEKLGGPDSRFNYLGEEVTVKEVPKNVVWFPFVKAVYFPSEAMFIVTFYGRVLHNPLARPRVDETSPFSGALPEDAAKKFLISGFGLEPGEIVITDSIQVIQVRESDGEAFVYLTASTSKNGKYGYLVETIKEGEGWKAKTWGRPNLLKTPDPITVNLLTLKYSSGYGYTAVYGMATEGVERIEVNFDGEIWGDSARDGSYLIVSRQVQRPTAVYAFDSYGKEIYRKEYRVPPGLRKYEIKKYSNSSIGEHLYPQFSHNRQNFIVNR